MQRLKIYLLFCWVDWIVSLALYTPSNIFADNKIIYNNNGSGMSYRNYVVAFGSPFPRLPVIFYGINNYQTGNRFYYQNMQTFLSDTQKTHFLLAVNPIQITTVYKFSIDYLAIDDDSNFVVLTRSYLNPILYTNQKTSRTVTIQQGYNFTQGNASGVLAVRGFYLQSITQHHLESRIHDIGDRNYTIFIATLSDCSINRLDISLLFYYPQTAAQDYVFSASQAYCFRNISWIIAYALVSKTDASVFFFGISGFGGITKSSYVNIGWYQKTGANYTSYIDINITNLQFICYDFIQIFALNPVYTPPVKPNITNNTTPVIDPIIPSQAASSNSTLIMIAAIAASTLLIMFIIILAIRRYWTSKYFSKEAIRKTKYQLSLTSVYQLPTLNF